MSSKKGKSSTSNGRDSNPKNLGVKKFSGELVLPGMIIVRQRGTKFFPSENVGMGKDHTLFSKVKGKVQFKKKNNRKYISVIA